MGACKERYNCVDCFDSWLVYRCFSLFFVVFRCLSLFLVFLFLFFFICCCTAVTAAVSATAVSDRYVRRRYM